MQVRIDQVRSRESAVRSPRVEVQSMRLWTIQGLHHWDECRVKGRLTGGVEGSHIDPDWRRAYDWMRSQMALRIPHFSGDFPVWAWVESPTGRLRHAGGWGAVDERMVLVVVDVPVSRVVLSSFHAWHAVLRDTPVDLDERGEPEPTCDKVLSWQRIFDPTDPVALEWGNPPMLQACVDGIDLHTEVVAVLPFKVHS